MTKKSLAFRIVCIDPPIADDTDLLRFGLQDKDKQLVRGDKKSTGSLVFNFELDVKQDKDKSPNFTGSYAHGSRSDRFLYLTLMSLQNDAWEIVKRIKIPLKTIRWEQVQALVDDHSKILEAKVRGQSSGTVPLLEDGWIVSGSNSATQ